MNSIYSFNEIKNSVEDVAKKYGVKSVYLFGSYAKDSAGEKSDIDLLIDKGKIKGLFELAGFHLDLEEKLNRKVDVLTRDGLSDDFLREIAKNEVLIYDEQ